MIEILSHSQKLAYFCAAKYNTLYFTEFIAEHYGMVLPSNSKNVFLKQPPLSRAWLWCLKHCLHRQLIGSGTEPVFWMCLEALKSHSGDAKCDRLSSHTSASHVLVLFTLPSICMRKALFCSTTSTEKSPTSAANSCSPQLEFICDRDRHGWGQGPPLWHTHTHIYFGQTFSTCRRRKSHLIK